MRRALAERIVSAKADGLTDAELLVAVLGHRLVVEHELLARADPDELIGAGLAPLDVAKLIAVVELGRRLLTPRTDRLVVDHAQVVDRLLRARLAAEEREHLVVVSLDRSRRVLAVDVASTGSPAFTIVDPPTIFRLALRRGAHSIVLAHNHPSGDPSPSRQDIDVTRRVIAAGQAVGIPLLDHVVIASQGYRAIADEIGVVQTGGLALFAS